MDGKLLGNTWKVWRREALFYLLYGSAKQGEKGGGVP